MMQTTLRGYDAQRDFMRIRRFLIDTFALYQRPFNWCLDRWNFCRYHVIPIHAHCSVRYFGVPTGTGRLERDELALWERTIGIWEDKAGRIVGAVLTENEEPGEAWIQVHPEATFLYDEMVTYIEAHLADRVKGVGYVKLYINEGTELEAVAEARGYRKLGRQRTVHLMHTWEDLPESQLPDGFVIRSVFDEDDVEKRRRAKAIAFGAHYGPSDWPPAEAFREMQQAPDYRKDLDLFIVAPDGEYVSFCTIWLDEANGYANFEPVGTQWEYQRMGLGRALLAEGFRRMAERGATRSYMGSGNEFYRKVGFELTSYACCPWIKYFDA